MTHVQTGLEFHSYYIYLYVFFCLFMFIGGVPSSSTDGQGTKTEDNNTVEVYHGVIEDFVADFVHGVDTDTDGIVTHEEGQGQEQEQVDEHTRLLKKKKSKSTKKTPKTVKKNSPTHLGTSPATDDLVCLDKYRKDFEPNYDYGEILKGSDTFSPLGPLEKSVDDMMFSKTERNGIAYNKTLKMAKSLYSLGDAGGTKQKNSTFR